MVTQRVLTHSGHRAFSTESSAFWKVSINLKTAGRGIVKVEIDGIDNVKQLPPKTVIRRGSAEVPDAYQILQAHLPQKEDFADVLKELEELQGAWKYYYPGTNAFALCSPMFNFDGDLLFELRRSQTLVGHSSTTTTNSSPISPRTRTGRSASPSPMSPRNGTANRQYASSPVERAQRSAPTSRSSSPVLGPERGRTPPPTGTRFSAGEVLVAAPSPTKASSEISMGGSVRQGSTGSRLGVTTTTNSSTYVHGRRDSEGAGVGMSVRLSVPQNGTHHPGELYPTRLQLLPADHAWQKTVQSARPLLLGGVRLYRGPGELDVDGE